MKREQNKHGRAAELDEMFGEIFDTEAVIDDLMKNTDCEAVIAELMTKTDFDSVMQLLNLESDIHPPQQDRK